MSLGAGYADREVEQDYTTWLANFAVTLMREYDETTLSLSSELAPSGSAELRKIYGLDLQYRRGLSTNINFTFATRFTISEPVQELILESNENIIIRPGLNYRLSEGWIMEMWYQYFSSQYENSEPINENSIYAGFRYDFGLLD